MGDQDRRPVAKRVGEAGVVASHSFTPFAPLLHFSDLSLLMGVDVTYSDVQYQIYGNTGRLTVLARSQALEFEELMPQ